MNGSNLNSEKQFCFVFHPSKGSLNVLGLVFLDNRILRIDYGLKRIQIQIGDLSENMDKIKIQKSIVDINLLYIAGIVFNVLCLRLCKKNQLDLNV